MKQPVVTILFPPLTLCHVGITKSTLFLCGKAEDVLSKQLEAPLQIQGNVIGVVDPPRTGLRELLSLSQNVCEVVRRM